MRTTEVYSVQLLVEYLYLYFETGWSKLEDRRKSRKLNLFDKIENNMAPTYLSDCLPTTIEEIVTYNLRNNDDYRTQRCRLQTSSKSFFPSTIKLWNSLPDSVKSLPTFSKFKKAIQPVQIPVASFYNIGDRKTNIIHTKLRHRCSGLNADLYRVNLKNDPRCVCGHLFEDAINFFLNVHFINTIELLCLAVLITLFPSL